MKFGQAVGHCFKNYANFNGRSSRSEFWFFMLFHLLVVTIPGLIGIVLLIAAANASPGGTGDNLDLAGVIGLFLVLIASVISLALVVPTYAVGSRRLHDRGTSGWLQLLVLIPCGAIVLVIFWLLDSQGPNSYGEGQLRLNEE